MNPLNRLFKSITFFFSFYDLYNILFVSLNANNAFSFYFFISPYFFYNFSYKYAPLWSYLLNYFAAKFNFYIYITELFKWTSNKFIFWFFYSSCSYLLSNSLSNSLILRNCLSIIYIASLYYYNNFLDVVCIWIF